MENQFYCPAQRDLFLDQLSLSSGDGFGLCVNTKKYAFSEPCIFVIYPKLVSVKKELFLKDIYQAAAVKKGFYEDVTLLKSSRAYQFGDNFKKINWRLLARENVLQVNVYETIQPKASFFILDLGSFQKSQVNPVTSEVEMTCLEEELEEMLSVAGSLFMELIEEEMACGLVLPKIGEKEGIIHLPDTGVAQTHLLLTEIAAVLYHGEVTKFDEEMILGSREELGRIYILSKSPDRLSCRSFLEKLEDHSITILSYEEQFSAFSVPVIPFSMIKKEGGSQG